MEGWTKRTLTWVMVYVSLMGVAVEVTEALDLGMCQNSCSSVPMDLWPYCCETHHTCCEEFADSCIHDCLPRVSSADVSAVEERPGLCCALYNLCCFRETPRISSIRNGQIPQQSIPTVHRFSTLPGGPMKDRQSPVIRKQTPQATINETPKPEQPWEREPNRRPGNFNRPQPARNTASSFRDSQKSKNQENTRPEISNSPQVNKRPNLRKFDVREPNNAKPIISENSKLQVEESETEPLSRPQGLDRPSKLRKFNRPGNLARPLETRKTDTPDTKEPSEELTNTNTPKVLERPGPRKLVRPEPIIRPTIPRKLNKPESEAVKVNEQDTQEEQRKLNKPAFAIRPLQLRKPTQSASTDQSSKPQKTSEAEPVQADRPRKISIPGPLIRPGETRKNTTPALDVTEKPEKVNNPESDNRPRAPRLLINRPNIKNQQLQKTNSDDDTPLKSGKDSDQVAHLSVKKDSPETHLEHENQSFSGYLPEKIEKPVAEDSEKGPRTAAAEVTRKGLVSPIRKVKRIRTNGPSKVPQSQNLSKLSQESSASETQNTDTETSIVTPTARPQVTRGRPRTRQEVTTFRPQLTQERSSRRTQATQERSRGRTQATQERSRGNTHVSRERTRGSTQVTQETRGSTQVTQETPRERTRGRSRERTQVVQDRSRERTQVSQERSGGRTQVTGARSRDQPQITTKRPVEDAQTPSVKSKNYLPVQEESTKRPLAEENLEKTQKEVTEITTNIPTVKEEKIMKAPEEMEIKTAEDAQTKMDKSDDGSQGTDTITAETPQEPREQSTNQPQIKKMKLIRPQVAIKSSDSEQPQEVKQNPDQPQEITQTEAKQSAERLFEPRQSSKPQQGTRQSSEPQATRQRSSEKQSTRQNSEPEQSTRQRSSAQPATRQRADRQPEPRQRADRQPEPRQSTARSRGRLTARQQLAQAQ